MAPTASPLASSTGALPRESEFTISAGRCTVDTWMPEKSPSGCDGSVRVGRRPGPCRCPGGTARRSSAVRGPASSSPTIVRSKPGTRSGTHQRADAERGVRGVHRADRRERGDADDHRAVVGSAGERHAGRRSRRRGATRWSGRGRSRRRSERPALEDRGCRRRRRGPSPSAARTGRRSGRRRRTCPTTRRRRGRRRAPRPPRRWSMLP